MAVSILVLVPFIIFAVIAIFIGIVAIKVTRAIKSTADSITPFFNEIKKADQAVQITPRTLDGTEPVRIPAILRDFPEFNVELARSYISNIMTEYMNALDTGDPSSLKDDCTSQFYEELLYTLMNNHISCKLPRVHKVVIADYRRIGEEAMITFQASVQYQKENSNYIKQAKYAIKYSYFLEMGAKGEYESLRCPHCGAPVSSIGMKVCPACDSAISFAISRTWKVSDIKEML
jgi:hypothetical protein